MKPAWCTGVAGCRRRGRLVAGAAALLAAARPVARRAGVAVGRRRGRCGAAGEPTAGSADAPPSSRNPPGVTVNALNRMFAWLAPQYSTHAPLNARAVVESGVYHR